MQFNEIDLLVHLAIRHGIFKSDDAARTVPCFIPNCDYMFRADSVQAHGSDYVRQKFKMHVD